MKRAFLSFVLAMACIAASSQGLIDIYKKKEVILKEDPSFGNNNWNQVFHDITATRDQGKDGKNKSIVVAPDGTIFMSHRSRHSISIFDKDGKYIRDFGQKGGKEADFIYMPTVIGIMDGKYVVTHAVDGRILLFDLSGKWAKTDRLDYMPISTIVLSNGKIALFGHTSWKTKFRHFVAIRDINTGTEKIIWDEFYPGPSPSAIVVTHKSGGMSSQSMPYTLPSSSRVQILPTPDGNLAIAFAETGEIKVYTTEGTFKKSFTVSAGERYTVTKEDRERNYSKIQEQIKSMEAMRENIPADKRARFDESLEQTKAQAGKLLDPNMYPEKLPVFSQVMFDSDNNLLVFAYTKESSQNSFTVYTYNLDGQQVAESTFISDNFNLNFGTAKFRFHKGSIIGVQSLKDEKSDVPVRLVKFSLGN